MKKLIVLISAVVAILPFTACADNKPIAYDRLPAPAKEFINTYFADAKVSITTIDKDFMETTYDVIFNDGRSVEFNKNGDWKDVDCQRNAIPEGIAPEQIAQYVAANHPGHFICDINRDKRDWEISLNNGIDLKFDLQFSLIEVDN